MKLSLTEQLLKARYLVSIIHAGQVDRGRVPISAHINAVADAVNEPVEKIVALLHEIIEDSHLSTCDLHEIGFDNDIVVAVDSISRQKDEDYFDYIKRVKANTIATKVKMADLMHNMRLDRLKKITIKDIERNKKYLDALWILLQD